jgi:hypothetical protein
VFKEECSRKSVQGRVFEEGAFEEEAFEEGAFKKGAFGEEVFEEGAYMSASRLPLLCNG